MGASAYVPREPIPGVSLLCIGLWAAVSLLVILPLLYIVRAFIADLQQLARGETDLQIERIEATVLEYTGEEVDVAEQFRLFVGNLFEVLFGSTADIATAGMKLSFGLVLVLFLVYYLLKDGARFVAWSRTVIPIGCSSGSTEPSGTSSSATSPSR